MHSYVDLRVKIFKKEVADYIYAAFIKKMIGKRK